MQKSDWLAAISLLISFLAFIRPEIAKVFNKLFGGIEFYSPGQIEIGYSNFGPTIAINCSVRSKHGIAFLRSMALSVKRRSDQSAYKFSWKVFRKINHLDRQKSELEAATAISLEENATRRVDILFSDVSSVARLEPFARTLQAALQAAANAKWNSPPETASGEFQKFAETFRQGKSIEISSLMMNLATEFYWSMGEYDLDVEFFIGRRKRPVVYRYQFRLTAHDERNLRMNFSRVVEDLTYKPNIVYTFAYPQITA